MYFDRRKSNRYRPDIYNLEAEPEVGRVTLRWEHEAGYSCITEVGVKDPDEEKFTTIARLDSEQKEYWVETEPLVDLIFRVRLIYPDGRRSNGKKIRAASLDRNVIIGEVDGRRLLIYLPDDYYDDPDIYYPVVYMHDGQNLFSESVSFAESWQVDKTLDWLISAGMTEKIAVVGIYNSPLRDDEYTPYIDKEEGGGDAWEFSEFIIDRIIPYIEDKYRVGLQRENRAIIGSSFGGLLALWMGLHYSEYFSMIGALSPSLWHADAAILEDLRYLPKQDLKIWIDQGTEEWSDLVREAVDILIEKGYEYGTDLLYYEVNGAEHSEVAWAERIEYPFIFFKGNPPDYLTDLSLEIEVVKDLDELTPTKFIINPVADFDNGLRYSLYNKAEYEIWSDGWADIDTKGEFEFDDIESIGVAVHYGNFSKTAYIDYLDIEESLQILQEKILEIIEVETLISGDDIFNESKGDYNLIPEINT